jgi:hypothetical protein
MHKVVFGKQQYLPREEMEGAFKYWGRYAGEETFNIYSVTRPLT